MFTIGFKTIILLFILCSLSSCGGGKAEDPSFVSIHDINTSNPKYQLTIELPLSLELYTPFTDQSFDVQGTCLVNGEIIMAINAVEKAKTSCRSNSFTATIQTSDLSEGLNSITAHYTISPLNAARIVRKDFLAPTLNINDYPINQSNHTNYPIRGTCSEDGALISGNFNGIPFSTTCTDGLFYSSSQDYSFLPDTDYDVTAKIEDEIGNISEDFTTSITKDTSVVLPSFELINPENGFGNSGSVTIRVSNISGGDDINTFTDSNCLGASLSTDISAGVSHDFSLLTASEKSYYFYFTVPAQAPGSCFGPLVYVEDLTEPISFDSIDLDSPSNGSTSSNSVPQFSGTIDSSEDGSRINIYNDSSCNNDPIGFSDIEQDQFNIAASLKLDGCHSGLNEFYARIVDRAGNVGNCESTGLSYTLSNTGLASLPKMAMIGSDSVTKLVSLEDNNDITWIKKSDPNNPIQFGPLSKGDVIYIEDPLDTNDKVDAGDIIESTNATYVVTQGYGTAPWASQAYSGKNFTSYQYRYGTTSKIIVTSLTGDSFVQIRQDSDNDGQLDTIDYSTVEKNQIVEFTTPLQNGKAFQIISNKDINVYYVSSANGGITYDRDARVLTPAAKDIIGFSWFITSLEDNTVVDAHRHEAGQSFFTADLDQTEVLDIDRTIQPDLVNFASRVIADKPVSMLQIADGDGTNAAPSLPISMLATHYGIPANAKFVSIVAPGTGNYYYTLPGNPEVGPIALDAPGNLNPDAPYAAKFTNSGNVPAGTLIRCDRPCYMLYNDHELGDGDETLMMGFSL